MSHSMINSAVVKVFINYLLDTWYMDPTKTSIQEDYLPTAATIVNLLDGISTISAFIVAYIAGSYLNCFTTIVMCALTYTGNSTFFSCVTNSLWLIKLLKKNVGIFERRLHKLKGTKNT